mmetsp:Transcript_22565/g.49919  ORF Transcript_22565/g.49919 Transcript_22565/m.49919 type:complete len:400 (-) Transcript_22565:179-1378(-)
MASALPLAPLTPLAPLAPLAPRPLARVASAMRGPDRGEAVAVGPSLVAGGGDGVFAQRAFLPGEQILQDPYLASVLRIWPDRLNGPLTLDDIYGALKASGKGPELLENGPSLYRGAPDKRLVGYYTEWGETAVEEPDERASVVEAMLVLAYNAYNSQPDNRYQLVYPLISKVNHSCTPNACVIAPENGPGEVICIKPIGAGDEVFVSYLCDSQLTHPLEDRATQFARNWEFVCSCPRCKALGDDTRRFSCPDDGCAGHCKGMTAESSDLEVLPCDECGRMPEEDVVRGWADLEDEIAELLKGLPENLYCAWCPCEEFAAKHPEHCLAGRWKYQLAEHTDCEAAAAEDTEEAETLRAEASVSRAAWRTCAEAAMGTPLEVPESPKRSKAPKLQLEQAPVC